jgi:hypothetical protein
MTFVLPRTHRSACPENERRRTPDRLQSLISAAVIGSRQHLGGCPRAGCEYRAPMESILSPDRAPAVIAGVERKHALIVLGIAMVAFTVGLALIDPSRVSSGPEIISFEFAASHSRAAQITAEWGAKGRSAAHLSLLLDYGYMVSYGVFFALAGFAIRDKARLHGWRRLASVGVVVPFFALAAAAFDAIENVALLLTLAGNGGSFAPPFAAVCSAIKFALIGSAILYVVCGLGAGVRGARRLRRPIHSRGAGW